MNSSESGIAVQDEIETEIGSSIDLEQRSESVSKPENIRDYAPLVEERIKKAQVRVKGNGDKKNQPSVKEIQNKLSRNEFGDAELFVEIFKEKYVFDSSDGKIGEFYLWNGFSWQADRDKERYRDMEMVAKTYEWAANRLSEEKDKEREKEIKDLRARAYLMRSAKRCKSVLELVASKIPFKGEWDYCPGKLPCKNGVIDLKTGSLTSPSPKDFIRTICPVNYEENAQCPLFDKFLNEITLDRKEVRTCIEDAFGSSLFGKPKEELVFYFYGEEGRNGKGSLLQTIEQVLGKLAKTFPSEMLLLQRNPPSSSSPNPELANLQGVRFAIFSEINKGRKIDSSKVKNLSGRDTIPCRRLYSGIDLAIKPSHTMFIQTNFKPEAPADDNALWTRNVLIPFEAYFCDSPDESKPNQRKKDPEIKTKLLEEKEGILAWLVQACINYQENGLRIPDSVKEATAAYRRENDGIQIFIEERCTIDSSLTTPCSKMQKEIKEFCEGIRIHVPNEREISKRLETQFQKKKTNAGWRYQGLGITPQHDNESDTM